MKWATLLSINHCMYGSLPSLSKIGLHHDHCWCPWFRCDNVYLSDRVSDSLSWIFLQESTCENPSDWLTCFVFTCTHRRSATSELSLYLLSSAPAAFQRHGSVLRIKAEEQSSHCFHRHEADCLGWKWFRVAVKKKNVKNELKWKQPVCSLHWNVLVEKIACSQTQPERLKIDGLTPCPMIDQLNTNQPTCTHSLPRPQMRSRRLFNWDINGMCLYALHQL